MRHYRCAGLPECGGEVILDEEVSHHVLRVVGVPPGGQVTLFDGSGHVATGELCRVEGGRAVFFVGPPRRGLEHAPRWLVLGQPKGPALDQAIRMATELGVDCIQVVHADRSIARSDKRGRWLRVAEAAVGQCGRATVPTLKAPCSLTQALARLPEGMVPVLADPSAETTLDAAACSGPLALLVGPEGGWSQAECAGARSAGARGLRLGRWILRTDTAVAAVMARTAPAA